MDKGGIVMQALTIKDILRATGGEIISKAGNTAGLEFDEITTDSRKVKDGVLFIPIAGDRFDGHDFIKSAIEHGASASLTHKNIEKTDGMTLIKVRDTRKALGDIARYYKRKYFVPSIAVTGSVGKTTTKDLVYAVLAEHYCTLKTPNNFNNDIGVPLTLFSLRAEHEMAVIEMGMNHFGEIDYLASIAEPDAAIITNIGMSHIENLGSQEGIFKAKMEIAARFGEKNTLFVNGDDKYLSTVKPLGYRLVKFGMNEGNDVRAKDIVNNGLKGIEFTVEYEGGAFRVEVLQPGVHNVYNALAAVCAGLHFGLSEEECKNGLRNCVYTAQRLEVIEHNGIEIINDCYNSSPDSIRAALKVQQQSVQSCKVAILGDVLEMGSYATEAHYSLGADVAASGIDMLITAGENAAEIARGARDAGMENVISYEKTDAVVEDISSLVHSGDSVLIKASHGMRFINITEAVMKL